MNRFRSSALLAVIAMLVALSLVAPPSGAVVRSEVRPPEASIRITTPPVTSLRVYNVRAFSSWNAVAQYCTISAAPAVRWTRHPNRKGATVGHYMRVKAELQTRAGFGGTLFKTIAKRKFRSRSFPIGQGLPVNWVFPLHTNLAFANGEYRVKFTVRVIRNVALGVDTTAWKAVYASRLIQGCFGEGSA
ncbi:MAG: hypothetical protein OEW42_16010 [Acidimicrobiia bacterium]|nr:hypothetical protein [Acidimicrobiia bacterium]